MSAHGQQFLETADRIGACLCRDAIWDSTRCNWLRWGLHGNSRKTVALQASDASVYSGTAGIAIFLAQLAAITGDRVHQRTAFGAIGQALDRMGQLTADHRSVFSGMAGVAWAAICLGDLLNEPKLVTRGTEVLLDVCQNEPASNVFDIIGGSAGTIQVLLQTANRAGRETQAETLLRMAIEEGNFLIERAETRNEGCVWQSNASERPLTGYAHGAAGIAVALAELFHATRDGRFRDTTAGALTYERAHFDDVRNNWPDFRLLDRPGEESPGFLSYWCHGAPGIGMSRIRIQEILPEDDLIRAEVDAAIQTTRCTLAPDAPDRLENYSLCHGLAGNAELMLQASELPERYHLRHVADEVGLRGIREVVEEGLEWPCGVFGGRETPGLMQGLAGIGYFFLRLFDPTRVPSILVIPTFTDRGQ